MNNLNCITWHARGVNRESIGINVNGNFSGMGWKGQNEPTQGQKNSLVWLLDFLYEHWLSHLDKRKSLILHSEISANRPADPGFILTDLIREYRSC